MVSKRGIRRRACDGKVSYPSKDAALRGQWPQTIPPKGRRGGLHPYHCAFCAQWHMGHGHTPHALVKTPPPPRPQPSLPPSALALMQSRDSAHTSQFVLTIHKNASLMVRRGLRDTMSLAKALQYVKSLAADKEFGCLIELRDADDRLLYTSIEAMTSVAPLKACPVKDPPMNSSVQVTPSPEVDSCIDALTEPASVLKHLDVRTYTPGKPNCARAIAWNMKELEHLLKLAHKKRVVVHSGDVLVLDTELGAATQQFRLRIHYSETVVSPAIFVGCDRLKAVEEAYRIHRGLMEGFVTLYSPGRVSGKYPPLLSTSPTWKLAKIAKPRAAQRAKKPLLQLAAPQPLLLLGPGSCLTYEMPPALAFAKGINR